jgi:hypothetical protein
VTQYNFPQGIMSVGNSASGPDGAMWFALPQQGALLKMSPPPSDSLLLSAVLPSSRSVQATDTVTAFAVMLNHSNTLLSECGLIPITTVPAKVYGFQATDPSTNTPIGQTNQRVSIAPGATQTFYFFFSEIDSPYATTQVVLGFDCAGVSPSIVGAGQTIAGVNTLLITADPKPVADIITVGLTPSNDGYARIPGVGGTGLFVIASTNIGAQTQLTARVRTLDPSTPVKAVVCETNVSDGQCKSTPSPTVTRNINHNENTFWSAFVTTTANASVLSDPAHNRIYFEFVDANGLVRGSTSTAVTTN